MSALTQPEPQQAGMICNAEEVAFLALLKSMDEASQEEMVSLLRVMADSNNREARTCYARLIDQSLGVIESVERGVAK